MPQFSTEWNSLLKVLAEDVRKALAEYECDSNNQFKRRTLIHFIFVAIEGAISIQKQAALALYKKFGQAGLSKSQIDWLMDDKFRHFKDNLKFAFKACAAVIGIDFDLNLGSDPRWQSFCHLQDIRNRITHPKHVDDMTISDEEIDRATQAFSWFAEKSKELQSRFHFQTQAIHHIIGPVTT